MKGDLEDPESLSTSNMMHGLENSASVSIPNLTPGSLGVQTANSLSSVITPHTNNNNNSMTNLPPQSSFMNSYNTGTSDYGTSLDTSSNNSASNFATPLCRQPSK